MPADMINLGRVTLAMGRGCKILKRPEIPNDLNNIPDDKSNRILKIILQIGLISRVFPNGPGDRGSVPGRVIPKTQEMILDAFFLNTHHCKVHIRG